MTDESRGRRWDDVTRGEHEDLKDRVKVVEGKLDRITWLLVATLVATLVDLFTKSVRI